MAQHTPMVLILGSGPSVLRSRDWPRAPFDTIVAINNAWQVRPDWDVLIHPEDFPPQRMPPAHRAGQKVVGAQTYVPAQNHYGGFVFAGGTMAFTAGYWALHALRPKVLAYLGCDMDYSAQGDTHFYGTGAADPLRDDISLRDLGAKSARLALMAAAQGCACVNLSDASRSALVFERHERSALVQGLRPVRFDKDQYDDVRAREAALGYETPTGRYWLERDRFDVAQLDRIDADWKALWASTRTQ